MKPLRKIFDLAEPHFEKGGSFEKLYCLYEAIDTFLFVPKDKTSGGAHVRDHIDLKRTMITVVLALIPCTIFAMWNGGYQAQLALANNPGITDLNAHISANGIAGIIMGFLGLTPDGTGDISHPIAILHGFLMFLPLYIVTQAVGGTFEGLFSSIRNHEINEGFLVTSLLFPLVLPPSLPLWQAGLGIAFGVVIGKEVFGGTGMNILNPALTARAFLFFAYAPRMSGDTVWVGVDNYTQATPLAVANVGGPKALEENFTWMDAFIGTIPGSLGETSTLCCLIGAAILIFSKVGSWRIMISCVAGLFAMSWIAMGCATPDAPAMSVSPMWHLVIGGFAFGTVFMATDPVSAAQTNTGRLIYGFMIGALCVLVRVLNPAYPEGMMLAILFMNLFAPLIDHYVIQANIKRRVARIGI